MCPAGKGVYLSIAGGHINPAITSAFAAVRPGSFSPVYLPTYLGAQFLGGFIASIFNVLIWSAYLHNFEDVHDVVRGSKGSQISAMVFGGYFPNPSVAIPQNAISWWYALLVEAWIAGVLAFMVFMLTDPHNKLIVPQAAPFFVGFTIATLVGLYESLTVACFNPARDFGPRLVALLWGWGGMAIPGPRAGFWIYLVGPLIGGPIGGALY